MLVGAMAVGETAFSQLAPAASVDGQRQIVARIEAVEARDGPHAEGLIGPLSALVFLHQENGDHIPAAAAIERVLQVVRANYGLHSLEQAPLLRQMIVSQEALGNPAAAWDLEQELLTLARRHPKDLRTVPILREIGAERLEILQRYLGGEAPPQIVLGCYYNRGSRMLRWSGTDGGARRVFSSRGSCHSGGKWTAAGALLVDAVARYEEAIAVIVRNELYASEELRELEMEILRTLLYGPEAGEARFPRYSLGRRSLERLFDYAVKTSAPPLQRVEALVRIADWDLLHGQNAAALRQYEAAYEALETQGAAAASIEHIFAPGTPVVLPAIVVNALAANDAEGATGHIDVAFEISDVGRSRRIEILDTSRNASDAAKDRLVTTLSTSRFRPRTTDGRFARWSPVTVRYYVSE